MLHEGAFLSEPARCPSSGGPRRQPRPATAAGAAAASFRCQKPGPGPEKPQAETLASRDRIHSRINSLHQRRDAPPSHAVPLAAHAATTHPVLSFVLVSSARNAFAEHVWFRHVRGCHCRRRARDGVFAVGLTVVFDPTRSCSTRPNAERWLGRPALSTCLAAGLAAAATGARHHLERRDRSYVGSWCASSARATRCGVCASTRRLGTTALTTSTTTIS